MLTAHSCGKDSSDRVQMWFAIGNLSTRRSCYGGRQPEVFLQHDGHCACQDVLGLQSRIPAVTDFKTRVFRLKPVVQKREYEHS